MRIGRLIQASMGGPPLPLSARAARPGKIGRRWTGSVNKVKRSATRTVKVDLIGRGSIFCSLQAAVQSPQLTHRVLSKRRSAHFGSLPLWHGIADTEPWRPHPAPLQTP
jgi:hypothetical protein